MRFNKLAIRLRKVNLLVLLILFNCLCTVTYAESLGTQESWTRKSAYRASTNQIVLHYGDGIDGADQIANILNRQGYPTIAVHGGTEGQVELFIGRGKFGKYTQDDLDGGTLGGSAINFYKRKIGADVNASSKRASLAK